MSERAFWHWFAGIIDGDGHIRIQKGRFASINIKVHVRDLDMFADPPMGGLGNNIKTTLQMGRLRFIKGLPYVEYIISIPSERYHVINNINGLIRLKVLNFIRAC